MERMYICGCGEHFEDPRYSTMPESFYDPWWINHVLLQASTKQRSFEEISRYVRVDGAKMPFTGIRKLCLLMSR
jgi:hypothetical protein